MERQVKQQSGSACSLPNAVIDFVEENSRREQEQALWATRVASGKLFFHVSYLATCDKNLICQIL
jgi:hypothetical protein